MSLDEEEKQNSETEKELRQVEEVSTSNTVIPTCLTNDERHKELLERYRE